ncbi:aldo/keto reductase [Paludisphaera mucosa]|uniref:Aldo/keto reductase n=1 Tax=Paludisphaera mucosa TaxID=3030827 RepID=A0ABT6F5J4_9BACT|nr:aldo/keto reductase [Paludisphaera mucosa]MDG3002713.1 aldo/keto reductase [Paludisphaera mucosa]
MEPTDPSISRRRFVRTGAVLGGVAAGLPLAAKGADDPAPGSIPQVVLGRTGAKVSRLGIGCAYFQRDKVTPDTVGATIHRALELGVNYLDTAPAYGTAEEKMGPTIKEVRDKVFLVTKTPDATYEGTWKSLRHSLKMLQTDHIDLVHLHNFGDENTWGDDKMVFGDKGAVGALREAKKQGVVRFIGASGHLHPSRFHAAMDTGEIDVLMNAVNFVVRHNYDFEHKVWSRARHMNLGLVAMKVLGGAGRPEGGFKMDERHYEQAVRYVLSIPGLAVAVMGLENVAELEKAVATVSKAKPFSPEEELEVSRLGLQLAASPEWKTAYGTPLT